jgi:hypothetical protein
MFLFKTGIAEGKEPSLVFALYCDTEDCENVSTWGLNRITVIGESIIGKQTPVKVSCEKYISNPNIITCNSINDMLNEAYLHELSLNSKTSVGKELSKVVSEKLENTANNIYNGGFNRFFGHTFRKWVRVVDNPSSMLRLINHRNDRFAIKISDSSYMSFKDSLREEYVKNHMDGTKTIGSYQFNENGDQVKWIVFKPENQEDFNKLFNHLNNCNVVGIPFKTENNYDILVMFSKYISAKIARKFAQDRLKEIDITCSILPKENKVKKDKNRHGEFMKLPFNGIDSKIMIKGKWRNDFNNLKIGFVDVDSIDKSVERDIV